MFIFSPCGYCMIDKKDSIVKPTQYEILKDGRSIIYAHCDAGHVYYLVIRGKFSDRCYEGLERVEYNG